MDRLKPYLPSLISSFQGAFTKEKHISDLFIIASECIHSMNLSKCKEGWIIIKLDVEKAFDTINWNFIEKILKLYKFLKNFNFLILSCIKNIQYTPIINGKKNWGIHS